MILLPPGRFPHFFRGTPQWTDLRRRLGRDAVLQCGPLSGEGLQTQTLGARIFLKIMGKTMWVCLKIGYIPNYSHLIGIMIITHWV